MPTDLTYIRYLRSKRKPLPWTSQAYLPSAQECLNPRRSKAPCEIDNLWSLTKPNDPGVAGQEHSDLLGLQS